MANLTRRQWLKVGLAVGGMVTFGLSYRDVAKRAIDGLLNGTSGKVTRDRIFGNALIPEAQAQTHWQQNPQQTIAMTQCFGCWTQCGIRARVNADGKVIRIAGNPYHPLSQEHPIDSSVPFSEAMEQLAGESGLDARSTACARGATLLESLYSPLRLLEPMKRVGKRGEGKWQRISFEQLIEEVVEGGDLFGEGHVDGLRAIHAPDTPIDAKHPSFGPKTNQLLVTNTSDEGRDAFLRRFALNSFGSKNFGAHGAYCGLAYRAGSGALMGDLDKNPHVKPDWENVEFALFMGTSPAQSGNPFKRQARQLASARLRENFQYVVVAPALPLSTVLADPRGRWQPVMPGSMMAGNGFYNAWSVMMLNALIGNLSLSGGVFVGGGKFNGVSDGPRYNMNSFAGKVKPSGLSIARSKTAYEASEEYRDKIAGGQSPYPAKAPWYPFVAGQLTELLTSALEGYPYPLKAWISNMSNPFYGVPGLRAVAEEKLKDPRRLPLFIAIDAFMNETTALADYIVPDTHNFESWGFTAPWGGVASKATTARWPVVAPATHRTADGQPVSMEAFCIAVAKRLHLPGFGDRAITDPQGNTFPLNRAEDFYLRVAANIAFMGKTPVALANQEDISLTGVSRILPAIQHTLKADEVGRVAFIYSRGGRFAPEDSGYTEQRLGNAWKKPLQIWNADVAAHRHAITGERFSGCPVWYPARLSDGRAIDDQFPIGQWPLKLISFKSNTMSSSTAVIPRLHHVKPANLVALNPQDGERYGLQHGDRVRIITPGGQVVAQISLLNGVMPGVIAIEHGYGHREMGATQHSLDGVPMPYDPQIRAGINLNDLGFADPTRTITNTWLDWVSGAAVRQGLPAKIERI
ncbi:molybdopterin dinucleotide binding domain-containing protein [Salmonella enterica]|uniref:molybdopterin dinucleotide binding domain-containing protein n=1 Tax=Salmonella TaxID=590 RepID=UPI0009B0A52F|nr:MULTISPECIES: molybdopterin dinucleotide binding domain-containing protein [Salmonella]MCL8655258.1 tetrathionate reductase subunit TtrA [Salmonella enterica subsp. enterica serovar Enteritidis]EBD7179471.1 tetrathionate reductase subunit TtrA [Salmonella enterica]ECH8114915.1 tetrathionate reductase subunit TtrA [Salmonella enterica subsp. enterica serovar Typhimurium]ECI0610163.1 tetrathionate reductase subunit TtrA [Salmonella enterica subsp. enterica serovar Typhimurium]ECI0826745.1 tet